MTCLVDLFRPSVGFAAVKLLEDAGCTVDVPRAQTCCGQPAYNSGRPRRRCATWRAAPSMRSHGYDYVVAPSGSCAGMLKRHYPELFDGGLRRGASAHASSPRRTYELVSFLADVRASTSVARAARRASPTTMPARACASSASSSSRAAYSQSVRGLELIELPERRGLLRLRRHLLRQIPGDLDQDGRRQGAPTIAATGAELVLAGDLGCLMNIAGRLSRRGSRRSQVRHVAEVLAGAAGQPPIGPRAEA